MENALIVNNLDVYTHFGIVLLERGCNDLVAIAPLKPVDYTEWKECDGIEPDLHDPKLNTQPVSMTFACVGAKNGAFDFLELLTKQTYNVFKISALRKLFSLRLTENPSFSAGNMLQVFTVQFANDFPMPTGYTYAAPHSTTTPTTGYEIDGRDLSQYGVCLLQGSEEEILKIPSAKQTLYRSNIAIHGGESPINEVRLMEKEVSLKCLLRAGDMDEFWRNRYALAADLIRPELRTLYCDGVGVECHFFYKSCSTLDFCCEGRVWWMFTLVLTLTDYGLSDNGCVLATQTGALAVVGSDDRAIALDAKFINE